MNKYIAILIGVLVTVLSFSSCTDQEDVEISYELNFGVTAAHLFDNYEPFVDDDFDMTKDGWKLHLQALIYDSNGILIDKAEKLCNNMSEVLNYTPSLSPGDYTVVCIADFREGLGGTGYKFWEISNVDNLQDLSITENHVIYPDVFETLGIDIQKIKITDNPIRISADIKPITSLVQVFTSDEDYSGWGFSGFSRFCSLTNSYVIKAIKYKDNIRIDNGKLKFKYSEQESDYNIAISKVARKMLNKGAKTEYCYRALLPEENKGFSYHIQLAELPQDYYNEMLSYCGKFEVDGKSNILPEIASNKQYIVNMIYDAMQLVAMEMPADYKHEEYTKQYVDSSTKFKMAKMVDTQFESLLGKDENFVNLFLNSKPESYDVAPNSYVAYYPHADSNHFERLIAAQYQNNDFTNCISLIMILPDLSEAMYQGLRKMLMAKFKEETPGKFGADIITYLEKDKPDDESRFRVVLKRSHNSNGKTLYVLQYVLMAKFY